LGWFFYSETALAWAVHAALDERPGLQRYVRKLVLAWNSSDLLTGATPVAILSRHHQVAGTPLTFILF
jgi:hypothetical protein